MRVFLLKELDNVKMSMIAFMTTIFVDSVKPLDIAFLSKCCKVYTQKQAVKKTDPQTYDKRKENH